MDDGASCTVGLLLAALAAVAMFVLGYHLGERGMQRQCVERGVAEWQVDAAGDTEFKFKESQ